jgi:amino-acid N-acetyltransferase
VDIRLAHPEETDRHGGAYLLRLVAVRDEARGRGIGAQLVCVALAAVDPARPVALLTETAAGWFPRFGFHPLDRAALDPALAASAELTRACPATAQAFLRPAS